MNLVSSDMEKGFLLLENKKYHNLWFINLKIVHLLTRSFCCNVRMTDKIISGFFWQFFICALSPRTINGHCNSITGQLLKLKIKTKFIFCLFILVNFCPNWEATDEWIPWRYSLGDQPADHLRRYWPWVVYRHFNRL